MRVCLSDGAQVGPDRLIPATRGHTPPQSEEWFHYDSVLGGRKRQHTVLIIMECAASGYEDGQAGTRLISAQRIDSKDDFKMTLCHEVLG